MIPHSTPAGKLKFTEVYLVSLRLHVCEPGSQESLSGFTQFPRWPWGYAGHSPSFSPTPCLACVGGGQVGENWPTPALVSSLVNCLPSSLCFKSASEKPPHRWRPSLDFTEPPAHHFTPSASAERAWEQSGRCSASPVPRPESCHLGHTYLSLNKSLPLSCRPGRTPGLDLHREHMIIVAGDHPAQRQRPPLPAHPSPASHALGLCHYDHRLL